MLCTHYNTYFQFVTSLTRNGEPADPLHGDDTYLKKRYSQFYMAAMDARYSGNYMRPSLDFLQSFGLNGTHLGNNW